MASGLLKLATLGGVAASGGGIVAGASMMSGSKQEVPEIQKTSTQVEAEENLAQSDDLSLFESKIPACIVYEAEKPIQEGGNSKFKKLLRKFGSKEEFLQKLNEKEVANTEAITTDVNNACGNTGGKKSLDGSIYVWYSESDKKWIYSTQMHEKDWSKDNEVVKSFTS
ncbi:hypothetical protein HF1_10230 [Mycoplasma haemofelis str. Langford 1]|uniref:Uncharacterized protein n=1 Tax=Mycoplasma haemofelis (strain Langford 1) TaxID=941640 RepID=E8ZIR0_MYCHL|nr:hypothetical protein [Mycoplasma haemofelis]CBY93031.1 hypothetical protein HF1_10230 [Mycoplasma haemofelis str. Langford 1]